MIARFRKRRNRLSNIKDYFLSIRSGHEMLRELIREYHIIDDTEVGLEGVRYDSDRVDSSPSGDQVISLVAVREKKKNRIKGKIDAILDEERKANDLIDKLDPDEQIVMRARYMREDNPDWPDIIADLAWERSQVYSIHGRALQHAGEIKDRTQSD